MGKVYLCGKVPKSIVPEPPLPTGTQWLYTSNGTFTVPISGNYQLELHGGGGGGGGSYGCYNQTAAKWWLFASGGGGGGSGEIFNVELTKETELPISIGAGGAKGSNITDYGDNNIQQTAESGKDGGYTSIGSYSVSGGKGGSGGSGSRESTTVGTGGSGSGSLGTSGSSGGKNEVSQTGTDSAYCPSAKGGQGNKNNTAQTYGDGGKSAWSPSAGQSGAVIITYMGVS